MKVFISSTCYDLIDVRLELAEELRTLGCLPLLSDVQTSDFEVSGAAGENSIQTCLNNVRQSDAVIVVLSQRYGSKLPSPPFEPVSATHLEYHEAYQAVAMSHRSVLLIDDTDLPRLGKAEFVVPAAIEDGFRVVACDRQTLLAR